MECQSVVIKTRGCERKQRGGGGGGGVTPIPYQRRDKLLIWMKHCYQQTWTRSFVTVDWGGAVLCTGGS